MPLATKSIIEAGEIRSRAPLKKSTIGFGLAAVVLLAVLGVLAPRLLRDNDAPLPPQQDRPLNAGQTRQIDGEFEDAQRRLRSQSQSQSQSQPPIGSPSVAATPLPPGSLQSLPATAPSVIPADVRRDHNSAVLYGRNPDPNDPSAALEMEAAARSSPGVKHDFGDAAVNASSPATDPNLARLRSLAADNNASPSGATSVTSAQDRLTGLLEAQQRRGETTPANTRSADRAWLQEWSDQPQRAALRPVAAPGAYTLLQGKVLPAILGRDLNTDLPGEVTAMVSEDIYDSLASRHLLIPKGSMLSGKYSNAVRTGQERILFAFTRITLPDGSSVDLPGFGGADHGGAAGIEGAVNNHFFKQFASSLLVAFLAYGVEKERSSPAIVAGTSQGGAVTAAGQVLVDVSRSILDRNKSIEPTITVAKGSRLLVEVTRDIEFPAAWKAR